jgi:hypothetical protein
VFAQGSTTNPNSSTTATFTYNKPARSQETTSGRSLSAEPIRPQAFRAHKPAHLASVRLNLLRPMYRRRS